jgi:predicted transcriptional regulator
MRENASVTTDKAKVTIYVDEELKSKLKEIAKKSDKSLSLTISDLLEPILFDDAVVIEISKDKSRSLQEWAKKEHRTVEGQINWLIDKALSELENS